MFRNLESVLGFDLPVGHLHPVIALHIVTKFLA
jgi:hypothetical protein